MSSYENMLVDIPDRTYRQKKNNVSYIYFYTNFFRSQTGKSRNKSLCIGKEDNKTGKIFPNKKFFDLFKEFKEISQYYSCDNCKNTKNFNNIEVKQKEPKENIENKEINGEVFNIGYVSAIEECFKELNLKEIIIDTFNEDLYRKIKIIASYIVKEGCVLSYIDDYSSKSLFFDTSEILTSQKVSDIFEELSQYEDSDFYRKWVNEISDNSYICYDVTSISTYSKMLLEAEYGYNRDKEDLPQLNIGLFTSEKSRYPVYMHTYNGSLNDKSELLYVIESAKSLGMEKIKLVLDGGFFDEERLKMLSKEEFIFTVGMPIFLNISKQIIDKYGCDIYSPQYITDFSGTYGKVVSNIKVHNIIGNIVIGHSLETSVMLNDDLTSKINRYKLEMDNIKKYNTVSHQKKYSDLFDITINESGNGFTYKENIQKINNIRKYFGYFLIFTTDINSSANSIIKIYRDKDTDEKAFYEMKQYFGGRRIRVHKKETFDGKYFLVFISLIFRRWLNNKLYNYKTSRHYTLKRCIMKLHDIRMYQDYQSIRLLKAITSEQRDLLKLCNINETNLIEQATSALQSSQRI